MFLILGSKIHQIQLRLSACDRQSSGKEVERKKGGNRRKERWGGEKKVWERRPLDFESVYALDIMREYGHYFTASLH